METAFLLLGSNLGDREANLRGALKRLTAVGRLVQTSVVYFTKPWGKADQPDFLNQAAALETELKAEKLLKEILSIELALGRARQEHWGPRLIDIDILLYGKQIVDLAHLQIPHPQLINRRFALVPLAEIAAGVHHPITGLTVQEHLNTCSDLLPVERVEVIRLT